jgi:hypothetical protein
MSYFATLDGEFSPAEAELSAGLSRITEAPTRYGLLFLVVNRTVVVHLVPITQLRHSDGRWTR